MPNFAYAAVFRTISGVATVACFMVLLTRFDLGPASQGASIEASDEPFGIGN